MSEEQFVGVVMAVLSVAVGLLGVRLLVPRLRDDMFARRGAGVRAVGQCVNLRWTSGGWVSSVIAYEDGNGERRFTATGAHPVIPIHIGETAEVCYDPQGRAMAVVNGEMPSKGFYVFCMVPFGVSLAFGAIGIHYLTTAF